MPTNIEDLDFWAALRRATRDVIQKTLQWNAENSPDDLTRPSSAAELFDSDRTAYRYENILGIDELKDAIESRQVVRDKFAMPDYSAGWPYSETVIHLHEVAGIPIVLADHYLNEYGPDLDDDNLSALYRRYERYLFGVAGKDLHADILVPILGANLKASVHAESNCSVIELDEEWKHAFSAVTAQSYDLNTMSEAKSALLIKNTDVEVEGFGAYYFASPGPDANDSIERFFEALAMESPGFTTWVQYAIEPFDWLASYSRSGNHRTVTLRRDYTIRIDGVRGRGVYQPHEIDEEKVRRVLQNQQLLVTCNKSARAAAKRLARALARVDADDRIIDLCIGLEALLGSGFSETVHRLSMRAAVLLTQLWGGSSADIYKAMRDLYSIRSKLVHGDHKPYDEPLLKVGETQVHASRFATAALVSLLRRLIPDERFSPDRVDQQFIFPAFDTVATLQKMGESERGLSGD